ncbi:hypothetical protein PH30N_02681 [Cutibacterium modestum 30N]|nr:hypothetical protein [Cutibacterium modestum 30N]
MHLRHTSRDLRTNPRFIRLSAIVVGEVASFIENGQTHGVEDGVDVTDFLYPEHPTRRHPRPRASWIKPKSTVAVTASATRESLSRQRRTFALFAYGAV